MNLKKSKTNHKNNQSRLSNIWIIDKFFGSLNQKSSIVTKIEVKNFNFIFFYLVKLN